MRIVREAHGLYRRPEPKLLAGTNFADVAAVCMLHGMQAAKIERSGFVESTHNIHALHGAAGRTLH